MVEQRWELLVLVAAVGLQLFYTQLYKGLELTDKIESFQAWASTLSLPTFFEDVLPAPGVSRPPLQQHIIEVKEYLSSGCEGPPARVWRVPLTSDPSSCLKLRPQLAVPGSDGSSGEGGGGGGGASAGVAAVVLHARASCEEMRNSDGGSIELCTDDTCGQCERMGVVREGECGASLIGFPAASWRCLQVGRDDEK
eukprot:TRINITY_DN125563_c0_g1_i1.p1 TRINITY_DN125563_c0_g1~~TRINITY_DN125563_c0_g1_i1.p1  ORF type:complete len:196 (+),score=39.83 TRINITY_DN125563_c0_g1_i1:91-678(+)